MAKFAGNAHDVRCAPKHPKTSRMCKKTHVSARVSHLRTVGYAAQVLKSDICTAPAQFRVGVIGLGIPWPHQGPQGVGP